MGAMGVLTKPIKTKETLDETFARIEHVHRRRATASVLLVDGDDGQARGRSPTLIARRRRARSRAVGTAADDALAARCAPSGRSTLIVIGLGPAGHEGLRPDRRDRARTPALRDVPMIVYSRRELTQEGRDCTSSGWRRRCVAEGRPLARAAARRGCAVPAPPVDDAARRTAADARAAAPAPSTVLAGQEGADRRRRHPQHLRDDQPARAAPDEHPLGRDRQGGDRDPADRRRTSTSC